MNRRSWATRQQLRIAIVTWIERTYHRRRRQRPLSGLTPLNSRPSCTHRPVRPRDYTCHLPVQTHNAAEHYL
ncbi:transposase [Micromonospora sp. M42]|nr:transposase [Micromonospora sp. M42]